ncbi:MAG TPA: DUF429 domain-containing protein [Beijerinckiaceae bacterium]|jgi:predicted RNase H-like nuclease
MTSTTLPTTLIAGVDGCPKGWVVALSPADDVSRPVVRVLPRLADLFDGPEAPQVTAIDMPLGLPDRVGPGGRGPEAIVRGLIGARRSSVFSVPSRAAVEAPDYPSACAAARATSDPPRAVSKQCFHLFPKIRELDALLRACPELRAKVFEAHPELSFRRLNGDRPLAEPKKLAGRGHPAGEAERVRLLAAGGIAPEALDARPPRGAARDDLLDALANLLTARRILQGKAQPHPDPPGCDAHGLRVAIWA